MWCVPGRYLVLCIIGGYCFQVGLTSYLDFPRINFNGKFRTDANTRNNDQCNYRPGVEPNPDTDQIDWNVNGTNEFEFIDTKVSSVFDMHGNEVKDEIINKSIIGNLDGPLAKISDSGERDSAFTIFGMKFGIKWSDGFPREKSDIAFLGKMSRGVITQYSWPRIPCYTSDNPGSHTFQTSMRFASQYTSTLTGIQWENLGNPKSKVLTQLHDRAGDEGTLSIRITVFYVTRNYAPYVAYNATLGYVVGSIGIYDDDFDTMSVPGRRVMVPQYPPMGLTKESFKKGDICHTYKGDYNQLQWTNYAPFEIDEGALQLDLSNSLPVNLHNSLRNIGTLKLGVLTAESCVSILNEEPLDYTSNDKFFKMSGIHSIEMSQHHHHMAHNNPLVLVQILVDNDNIPEDRRDQHKPICGEPGIAAQILLQEQMYFLRPMSYYVDFLEKDYPTCSQSVYVTRYGRPVEVTVAVHALDDEANGGVGPPKGGVMPVYSQADTNSNGQAEFHFYWNEEAHIPANRTYYKPPCSNDIDIHTLPIDGQVYFFKYCIKMDKRYCSDIEIQFLAFSEYTFNKTELTWMDNVQPIFAQYAQVSPMMTKIIDLSSYSEVVRNKDLLVMVLSITDLDDPAYMPTTRDLSIAKRSMILEWLQSDHPRYGSKDSAVLNVPKPQCKGIPKSFIDSPHLLTDYFMGEEFQPPETRCNGILSFDDPPELHDPRLEAILTAIEFVDKYISLEENCTKESVMAKLQEAVSLEWSTIPVYLTSLYSVVEGCNEEIYELIHSVVIEEMLHLTQAANTLIAMGGRPLIDDKSVAPALPHQGLPGNVLPGLNVTLEKLSLKHIHEVFMSIEVPEFRSATTERTIGRFYKEMEDCIAKLPDEDFQSSTKQVEWPWKEVVKVSSSATAVQGLQMIILQGEGAGHLSPEEVDNKTYAHFYKFEEIVCQHRLHKINDTHYRYNGTYIPFQKNGVWPMRSNPMVCSIPNPSNCYTESRAFHQVYRMLLRKLQDVFDEAIHEDMVVALELMESLQAHAKKLMWTKLKPNSPEHETCGLVWDYDWCENCDTEGVCRDA